MARLIFSVMISVSFIILVRGHNDPGGGFVAGLIAASAFSILDLAVGVGETRRVLRVHPIVLMGCGLFLAFLSGIPGIVLNGSFLAHHWVTLPLGIKIGTPTTFDVGVYLAVLGGVLAILFRLYEEPPE